MHIIFTELTVSVTPAHRVSLERQHTPAFSLINSMLNAIFHHCCFGLASHMCPEMDQEVNSDPSRFVDPASTDMSTVPFAHPLLHLWHKHLGKRWWTCEPWKAWEPWLLNFYVCMRTITFLFSTTSIFYICSFSSELCIFHGVNTLAFSEIVCPNTSMKFVLKFELIRIYTINFPVLSLMGNSLYLMNKYTG